MLSYPYTTQFSFYNYLSAELCLCQAITIKINAAGTAKYLPSGFGKQFRIDINDGYITYMQSAA